jgi:hypothetical protein
MGDFFAFRRMLAPVLIHIIFWVGVLGSVAVGGGIISEHIPLKTLKVGDKELPELLGVKNLDDLKLPIGIAIIVLGPLVIRLDCELLMLPFRINGTLTDIRNTLITQGGGGVLPGPAPRR